RVSTFRFRNREIAAQAVLPPIKGDGPTCLFNQCFHHAAAETIPCRGGDQWTAKLAPADRELALGRLRPRHTRFAARQGESAILCGIRREFMHYHRERLSNSGLQHDPRAFNESALAVSSVGGKLLRDQLAQLSTGPRDATNSECAFARA